MPGASKAKKASQTKTTRAKKAPAKAKAGGGLKAKAKAKSKTQGTGQLKLVVSNKKVTPAEPRNVIMELWRAKEEKRRNETPHLKFQETGPPKAYSSNQKHDRFARFAGPRRRTSG